MRHRDVQALRPAIAPYGDRLAPDVPPGADVVPGVSYMEPLRVRSALRLLAYEMGASDLKAVASFWHKHYCAAVCLGTLAAMTAAGVGLHVPLCAISVVVVDGLPRAILPRNLAGTVIYRPRLRVAVDAPEARSLAELHRAVFGGLLGSNLALVGESLHEATGVARSVLWGNVANVVAHLYEEWEGRLEIARAVAEDRAALLEAAVNPALPGPNPLRDQVRYEGSGDPGLPERMRVRRTCCAKHRLPGKEMCYTCPLLSREERLHALRKRLLIRA